jgi:outer membrane immunogenic protein
MAKLHTRVIALAVGAAGLCGFAAAASADGYQKRGYAPAGCCFSWSGMYVGINGGYGFSADDQAVVNIETIQAPGAANPNGVGTFGSLDPDGGFGGIQVGYNFQGGPWVFGVEADLQGGDISDSSTGTVTNFLPGLNATLDTTLRLGWFGTARARLGYSWNQTLIYATGGFAYGSVKHTMLFRDNFGFVGQAAQSESKVGYVLGAGIEHAFNCCWSVKLEYQYIDLGDEDWNAPLLFVAGGGAATVFRENTATDLDFHTVRLGLNWKWHDRREAKPLK